MQNNTPLLTKFGVYSSLLLGFLLYAVVLSGNRVQAIVPDVRQTGSLANPPAVQYCTFVLHQSCIDIYRRRY